MMVVVDNNDGAFALLIVHLFDAFLWAFFIFIFFMCKISE